MQGQVFTIQVTDATGNIASQSYAVSILLQPDTLLLSAPVLAFGGQVVGSQGVELTETLTNNANSPIAISGIAIGTGPTSNAGEFTQTSTTCGSSLAAGANCAIMVTFAPAQSGPRAGFSH